MNSKRDCVAARRTKHVNALYKGAPFRVGFRRRLRTDGVGVGIVIAHNPLHRSGRAVYPHEMCSNTFHTVCGLQNYVAPTGQAHWNQQSGDSGRHITTSAKVRAKTSSVPGHPANAVAACLHQQLHTWPKPWLSSPNRFLHKCWLCREKHCPSQARMVLMSTPARSKCVAVEWRMVWGLIRFAASEGIWTWALWTYRSTRA